MTTSSNYAYRTFDDIVFEGRNREYGAYLLRKIYTRNLWRGLVTASTLFILLLSIPLVVQKLFPRQAVIPPTIIPDNARLKFIEIVLPPDPIVQPKEEVVAAVEQPEVAMEKFVNPVIKKEPTKTSAMPEQEVLSKTNIGTETLTGDPTAPAIVAPEITGTKTGGEVIAQPVIHFASDELPEFPGGVAAMQKYLAENIVYPPLAKKTGLEGMVILSFVVNTEGDISGVQVLKALGGGTEAEAIRVLKSMPQWKPGKNQGVPVNVRFTVPVRFKLK